MPTNRSQTEEEEMLNHLLISIVIAVGGSVLSTDKIALLQSWLDAL